MATFSKTANLTLLALQSVAASTVVLGTAVSVADKLGGLVYVRFGRRSATAAGAGANIRIEASSKTSGDNTWYPIAIFTTAFATAEAEALTGTVNAGQKVCTLASTTNLTAGDVAFLDNSTIANSEWVRIKSVVTNTSVTVEDDLVNAQTSSTLYDSAEIYPPIQIPEGAIRLRAVADGSLFTQAFAIEVIYSTIDGIA